MKRKIYDIINSKIWNNMISILVVISIVQIVLESFQSIFEKYNFVFKGVELVIIIIFTTDYIFEIYTSEIRYKKGKFKSILKFMTSFEGIIDLLSMLPFYMPLIIRMDLRFLRILRLGRIIRMFKIKRVEKAINVLKRVWRKEKDILFVTIMFAFSVVLISAIIMYNLENPVQPDKFPNIVATMWWSVATLTTIGYGDVYPVTAGGKILATCVAMMGIGFVAVPTGLISAGFVSEIREEKNKKD